MSRYIGDVLFDKLNSNPDFLDAARSLVAADWRTGMESFQDYVKPLLNKIFAAGGFEAWGDLSYSYLELRVMDHLDPQREPWLWTYARLVGAYIEPGEARTALNAIQGQ